MTDNQNDDFIKKKRREIRERIFRDKSKYNVGKEGRLTGVTRKENVLKDKDDMDNVEDFFMSENDESSDNKEDSENEVNLKLTRKRRSITQPIVPLKENSANIKDNKKKDEGGKKGNRKVSIQTISSPTEFENSLLDPSIFDSTNSLDQSTSPNPPPKLNENQTEKTSQKQKGSKIDVVKDKGEKKTVSKGVPVKLTEKEKEISNLLERSSNKDSDDNEDILDDSKKEEEEEGEKKLSRKELRRLKNGEINKPIRDRKISISLSAFLDDPPADNLDQSEAGGQGYDDMIDNIIDFSEDRVDDIEEAVNAKSSKSSARTSKPSSKEQSDDDDNRVNQKNKTKENKTMQKKKEETVKGKKNSNNLHYFEPPESPFPHSTRDTVAPLNDIDFENDDEIENEDDHHKRPVNNKLKSNKIKENKENATKKAKAAKKIEVNKERKRGGKKEYDNNVNYAADDSVLNDEDDSVLLENRLAEEEDSDFTEGNISKRIDDEEELSDYENDITKDEFSVLQSDPALSTPKNLSLSQLANYKVDLNNKTTTELKSELKKMKLETSGNKGQLIDRILDNLSSQPSSSPGRSPFHSSTSSSHTLKSPKYQTPNRKYPKRKTRITPLEYWKNERVVYSRNKSGLKIIKEEEDDEDHSVKASQPKKKQKVEPLILSESQVYNIQTKSYLPFGVAKSMDMMEMEPYSEDQEDLENGVQKCEAFGFTDLKSGSIYIPPNQTTDVQKPTNEHRVFYIQQGNLEVTICKTTLKLVKGCHFFVPPGNKFEMKNTSPLHTAIVVYFNALFDV